MSMRGIGVLLRADSYAALSSPMMAIEPSPTGPDRIFYDGDCGICHASVKFVLRRDRRAQRFRYAPLDGPTFRELFSEDERKQLRGSAVVRASDGRVFVRSDATVYILTGLGGRWRAVGRSLHAVPRPLRDAGYRLVAFIRRALTRKPGGACPMVEPALRARFDP